MSSDLIIGQKNMKILQIVMKLLQLWLNIIHAHFMFDMEKVKSHY
jgi:hypothetical protein